MTENPPILTKVCTTCKIEKTIESFHVDKRRKDGRQRQCKECRKIYSSERYKNNKEKIDSQNKKYYENNTEKIKEKAKEYYKDSKEKRKELRQKNKKRQSEIRKERMKLDIGFRLKINTSGNLYKLLKSKKTHKDNTLLPFIGCSLEELKQHLNSTINSELTEKHVDHIIPYTAYDLTIESELKKCMNWRNLRYVSKQENSEKNGNLDMDLVRFYKIEDLLPANLEK